MGCSSSKLDNEKAVQLCKDRKLFIKQAVEHRMQFASGHVAYIQSLKKVSAALRDYIEGDECHGFSLDSYRLPPFVPVKKTSAGLISVSSKTSSVMPLQFETKSSLKMNYLRSGGNPSVAVEERPQSPETVHIQMYSPVNHYGIGGFFAMQSSPTNPSFFSSSPPCSRPNLPPPSPQTSQWELFWNPFSSLDYYGYPTGSSLEQNVQDDVTGPKNVREEEGIHKLQQESPREELAKNIDMPGERANIDMNCDTENGTKTEDKLVGLQSCGSQRMELSEKAQNAAQLSNQETTMGDQKDNKEKPGFTVYVDQKPTSLEEVVKDLEAQFTILCNAANEVSVILKDSKAQYSPTSDEVTVAKMLNPVTLIHSASSGSSSSRLLINTSCSKDGSNESCSNVSEESCMFPGRHRSTLDRLYAWEKKLYEEVRAGERVRIAYEKRCSQLRSLDGEGEETSDDKARSAIRDLHSQIKVSIHSIEAVSRRIKTLIDEELQPQLLELVQGLAGMWKVIAECHQMQKQTLDEAKLLLAAGAMPLKPSETKKQHTTTSPPEQHQLARSAANLETELRNWRACFESWITSQRSYIHALTGWLLRCIYSDPNESRLPPPLSPTSPTDKAPPIFRICIQWSRFLDDIREVPVLEGLDFFASGVGSLYAQLVLKDDSRQTPVGAKRLGGGKTEVVEEVMTAEKMAEVSIRVLCAGMSVAVTSLTEFASGSAKGYADLLEAIQLG